MMIELVQFPPVERTKDMSREDYLRVNRVNPLGQFRSMAADFIGQERLFNLARHLSVLSLGATFIFAPLRYRFLIYEIPMPPIYGDYTNWLVYASDVFVLATLIFWGIRWLLRPYKLNLRPIFMSAPILGFTLLGFVSVFTSVEPRISAYHAVRMAILFLVYLYLINEVKSPSVLLLPICLQLLPQAAIGIAQVLQQQSIGLYYLGELKLDPSWRWVSIVWGEGIRSLRAYGLTEHPNILGGCLAFGLLLILSLMNKTRSGLQFPLIGLLGLGSSALLLTFSRSAWLAVALALIFSLVWLVKRRLTKPAITWLSAILACGIFTLPFIWQNAPFIAVRLNWQGSFEQVGVEIQSINERRLINRAANQIFSEHAILGIGLGAFPAALRDRYPNWPLDYQPPHFVLLDVAAEIGIFGALCYSVAMLAPWLALWINRKRLRVTPILVGISAALLATIIVGLFDYYTWFWNAGQFWQWVIWGTWGVVYHSALREDSVE